ncbi:hypothetical protein M408DRAFT_30324 [Serendipita vermifera MAFF 305830]|uniref:Uncharacterized protein n=1 Tax=Serendipita vermifera MAFF 305830 TaxID=933852 RepID=A0A0C2WSE9_SERVB|nr:hypothetical protein M408DRAFT_30324 [Serendipita vermifera MAFF 305830]
MPQSFPQFPYIREPKSFVAPTLSMLFQKFVVATCLSSLVSAGVIRRQSVDPPAGCVAQCTDLASITDTSNWVSICTPRFQQGFITCVSCIETNVPSALSPDTLTFFQSIMNYATNACTYLGFPLSSVSVPGATGTTSLPTSIYPPIPTARV